MDFVLFEILRIISTPREDVKFSCEARQSVSGGGPTYPSSAPLSLPTTMEEHGAGMTMQSPRVVLVIEDQANIVAVIKQSLRDMFVEIVAVEDGEAGVEQVAQLEPDLVLLDLALPGISGWEALQAIRETPYGASLPVVVVTAHGDSETAVRARESGANAFITKPFLPSELRRVVDGYLTSTVADSA
jgi:CheY-like chemotaxis protein